MTAETADIRFECSNCGQHLVVEPAGAGLMTTCPICETPVTVPAAPIFTTRERVVTSADEASRRHYNHAAGNGGRPQYADPGVNEMREELIDASMRNGHLDREIAAGRTEIQQLQAQLKALTEECERLNASATHTQAELKTFQSERQQFKTELSGTRQKLAAAESQLAAREQELVQARSQGAETAPNVTLPETAPLEGRIADLESTLAQERTRNEQLTADWQQTQVRCQALESGLQEKTQECHAIRLELSDLQARSTQTETALAEEQQKFQQVVGELARHQEQFAALQTEAQTFQQNWQLAQRNLEDLQSRLTQAETTLDAERQQHAVSISENTHLRQELTTQQTAATVLQQELQQREVTLTQARSDLQFLETSRAELQRKLDDAHGPLQEGAENKIKLAQTLEELNGVQAKLASSEESLKSLEACCEGLRKETDTLKRDLSESHTGREVLALRDRLETLGSDNDRTVARLALVEEDLKALTNTEAKLRAEGEDLRHQREELQNRLNAVSESQTMRDNEVLRGIIARQNSELAQRHGEIFKLKRAGFTLKIVYTLFALGLVAVVALAIKVLPRALNF